MAPQAIEIAPNGLGDRALALAVAGRRIAYQSISSLYAFAA
jgi:hypothetical protein